MKGFSPWSWPKIDQYVQTLKEKNIGVFRGCNRIKIDAKIKI
jgi:hypothetical protein